MTLYHVQPQALARFAEAVRCLGIIPPTFLIVPMLPAALEVARRNGIDPARAVHRAQGMTLHRPIRPGEWLSVTARLRETRTVHGATVARVLVEVHGAGAEPVCSGRTTLLAGGPPAPAHPVEPPPHAVTLSLRQEDIHAYAEASGDHNPLHLDPEAARAAGYPDVLAHGMLTLALGLTRLRGLARLSGFDAVFTHPVHPSPADPLLVHAADGALSIHHRGHRAVSVTNLTWSLPCHSSPSPDSPRSSAAASATTAARRSPSPLWTPASPNSATTRWPSTS